MPESCGFKRAVAGLLGVVTVLAVTGAPALQAAPPGSATLLTYVEKNTTCFKDSGAGFDGQPLQGVWYYRVTAVDSAGNEGPAAPAVGVEFP